MKNGKLNKAVLLIVVLLAITAIAAVVHLSTREDVAEGTVLIQAGEESYEVQLAELDYEHVTGTRVDGKGDEKEVDGQGILLKDLLAKTDVKDYTEINVVADDSYTASLTKAEVEEAGKVYLILQEEGGLRLIVFGDSNSKRSVSNVVQIVINE